ncbi:hypothetical protein QE152_g3785 [Popillia japonica]|uniref:Uncharacterized protein n=1 Tax=Popillia japonica TaxID=7064 RepID=A0AAW1N146_POPJA
MSPDKNVKLSVLYRGLGHVSDHEIAEVPVLLFHANQRRKESQSRPVVRRSPGFPGLMQISAAKRVNRDLWSEDHRDFRGCINMMKLRAASASGKTCF